ncbi:MAG: chorismate synthase [candidate division KSB1 bacterium]|nr:chorismate synthase [candidate division KSB1 bacterium]
MPAKLQMLTAGESHGRALVGILEGFPANVPVRKEDIDRQLARRQLGYGRGGRMKIERDQVEVLSGVRFGKTLGSPIALLIWNRDWPNWESLMDPWAPPAGYEPLVAPRPGHADFPGWFKYRHGDLRNVLERASARETAVRVALGAFCRLLLAQFGVELASHVVEVGGVRATHLPDELLDPQRCEPRILAELNARADASPVRCLDPEAEKAMMEVIDKAREERDTVGGQFEIVAAGLPVGLGSHVHWERRLDGRIAQAVMSIPAIKAVEIGLGTQASGTLGSQAHDEILYEDGRFVRRTNRAGGVEGGMTNGLPIVVRATMKPLPTLMQPLRTVDLVRREERRAIVERADVCAVPAASVVAESMLAFVLADALCEMFGNDSLEQMRSHYEAYRVQMGL